MAGAARCEVAPVRLSVRRVTTKTGDVRIQSRGNRESNSAAVSSMTSGTRSAGMFCVIESSAETAQRWKGFDFPALNIGVTDRADLARRV